MKKYLRQLVQVLVIVATLLGFVTPTTFASKANDFDSEALTVESFQSWVLAQTRVRSEQSEEARAFYHEFSFNPPIPWLSHAVATYEFGVTGNTRNQSTGIYR